MGVPVPSTATLLLAARSSWPVFAVSLAVTVSMLPMLPVLAIPSLPVHLAVVLGPVPALAVRVVVATPPPAPTFAAAPILLPTVPVHTTTLALPLLLLLPSRCIVT